MQLCIIVMGLLIMVGVIPLKRIPAYLGALILLFVLGPAFYAMGKQKACQYLAGPHEWWEYVVLFVVMLLLLRIILDFIMPWRRKR